MNVSDYIWAVIEREGPFSDHPADRGGKTTWGITETVARAYGYLGDMRNLSQDTAFQIYLERYWTQPRFHWIDPISPVIAEELLDTGVNRGQGTATIYLQRALNVLNNEGKHYPDIKVDGSVGKLTIAALRAFLDRRGTDGVTVLMRLLNSQQGVDYMVIAEKNPSQEAFVYGWTLNRVS